MNVYLLTADSTQDNIAASAHLQRKYQNAFLKALKGSPLIAEFSRVSPAESGKMLVVCSEDVAHYLRKHKDLGIKALEFDAVRTTRRRQIYEYRRDLHR